MKIERNEKIIEGLKSKVPEGVFVSGLLLKGDAGEIVKRGDDASYRIVMYGGTLITAYRVNNKVFLLGGYFQKKELMEAWESSI